MGKYVSISNIVRFFTGFKSYYEEKIDKISNKTDSNEAFIQQMDERLSALESKGLTQEQYNKLLYLLNELFDSDSDLGDLNNTTEN